jgi:hypothetical protein
MAIKKTYCLYDHTAMVFLNNLVFENDAKAIQWFTTIVNTDDKTQTPALYPESFTLYRLLDFDDKKGTFVPRDSEQSDEIKYTPEALQPKAIITGVEVADKVNMKFTMKQLLTALKSDLLTHDQKDNNVVDIANEVSN